MQPSKRVRMHVDDFNNLMRKVIGISKTIFCLGVALLVMGILSDNTGSAITGMTLMGVGLAYFASTGLFLAMTIERFADTETPYLDKIHPVLEVRTNIRA